MNAARGPRSRSVFNRTDMSGFFGVGFGVTVISSWLSGRYAVGAAMLRGTLINTAGR